MTPEQRRQWVRSVLGCTALTASHKTVLMALETYADYRDGTNARPGEANLAQMCGLKPRAVRYALEAGQQLGLIQRTRAANSRAGLAAVYRLLAPVTTGTTVPVNNSTTGTAVPVNDPTTGMTMPVNEATTGTLKHHDRHSHDSTTGTSVPPTIQAPSKHQGVLRDGGTSLALDDAITHTNPSPSQFCDRHPLGYRGKCGDCGNARTAFRAWQAEQAQHDAEIAVYEDFERRRRRQVIERCTACDDFGRDDDLGTCEHPPSAQRLAQNA